MTDKTDVMLTGLLAPPARVPDEMFVRAVRLEVEAEQRLRAANRKLLRKFASDLIGGVAIVLAFILLARAQPPGPDGMELVLFSPAMLGVLVLGLWAAATLPAGNAEARG